MMFANYNDGVSGLFVLQGKTRLWRWFDDRTGRWSNYASGNNKSIDDAYRAGKQSVRYAAARRAVKQCVFVIRFISVLER